MAFHTFGPGLALDKITMKGLSTVTAQLTDAETGEPVQAYTMDEVPAETLVTTNRYGYFPQFKVPDTTRQLRMTFGGLTLENIAWELLEEARQAADDAAAVAAEITGRDLLDGSDPRIPQEVITVTDEYLEAFVDKEGRVALGIQKDGSVDIPLLETKHLNLDGVATVEKFAADGYLSGTVDSEGRLAEDALLKNGRTPDWVLAAWKERMGMESSPTTIPPLDLVIGAGQSNMGASDPRPAAVPAEPVPTRLYYYNSASGAISAYPSAGVSGYRDTALYAFAVEHLKTLPAGRGVLMVQTNQGSSGFTTSSIVPPPAGYHTNSGVGTWDRTLTADPLNYYARMITRATGAKAAAPSGSEYAALLWSHGESDISYLDEAQYTAKLVDLIATARTTLSAPKMIAVIGSMVPEWVEASTARLPITYALESMPAQLERVGYGWGPEGLTDLQSNIHWSVQGQRARGPILKAAYDRALWNVETTEPQPPQNLRVRRSGGDVLVEWEHPPARSLTFVLEHRIDGGAWTAAPLNTALTRTATLALGLAATSTIGIRMKTTNTVGTSGYTREVKA